MIPGVVLGRIYDCSPVTRSVDEESGGLYGASMEDMLFAPCGGVIVHPGMLECIECDVLWAVFVQVAVQGF